jgi:hypothetical protein
VVLISRPIGGSGRPDLHGGGEDHSHQLGEHHHHKDQQVSTLSSGNDCLEDMATLTASAKTIISSDFSAIPGLG